MTTNTLPDKPSALLRVALADLAKCMAQPDVYEIDMAYWHVPSYGLSSTRNSRCIVCLAGSIMAQTFGILPTIKVEPKTFAIDVERKFEAINDFRQGEWREGFETLEIAYGELNPMFYEIDKYDYESANGVPDVYEDPTEFFKYMHEVADIMEKYSQ